MGKVSENTKRNNARTLLVVVVDKQVKQLSKMQVELLKTEISAEDYNEITEQMGNLKEYMINCRSYNLN